jgi:hypothetical protein
MMRRMLPG